MPVKVVMPKLGESVVEGTVTRWIKQEGEKIQEFESMLEVETAKVTTEIPSPASGVVLKILVPEGVTVNAGVILAWIGQEGEQVPSDSVEPSSSVQSPAIKAASGEKILVTAIPAVEKNLGFISPIVAKLAAENSIDLGAVVGTGDRGRITKKDVQNYLEVMGSRGLKKTEPAPWETPGSGDLFKPTDQLYSQQTVPVPTGPIQSPTPGSNGDTLLPLTARRKAIADHMVYSKHTSPHVTTVMEADLSRVIVHKSANQAQYERDGIKLTFTAYFIAAASGAFAQHSIINSSWTEKGILIHRDVNIGMAVSLGEDGLIVPVIRQADHLNLMGLALAINDLSSRARSKKLLPDETTGGTFSITNHGTGRSLFATPVINQPQCAILGVGAIYKRPVVIQDAIAIRPMVYLSLTFDHRILDGSAADAFLSEVVDTLEKWQTN